jgi:hypothetical protein
MMDVALLLAVCAVLCAAAAPVNAQIGVTPVAGVLLGKHKPAQDN